MAKFIASIIAFVILVLLFSLGIIALYAFLRLTLAGIDKVDNWFDHNADKLFTLDIELFKKKK